MEQNSVELRSEEVQEIMGTVPSWIVRWGIAMIFLVIVMLLGISSFIYYPDVIEGEITLTTTMPPVKSVVRIPGKIRKIYVSEQALVQAGDMLAEMENPSNADNIAFLNNVVNTFDRFFEKPDDFSTELLNKDLIAGELQNEYNNLRKAYKDFTVFMNTNYYSSRVNNLEDQINNYQSLSHIIEKQRAYAEAELRNAREQYNTDKQLFDDKVISKSELRGTEDKMLQKQREYESINRSAVDNRIILAESRKMLLEMDHERSEMKRSYILNIQNIINNLRNLTHQWEQNYLFRAPVDGRVSFLKNWSENQFVNSGEELLAVVPSAEELGGVVYLSSSGLGKVREGQKVRIQIYDYPHEQYGQLLGRVTSVSLISRDSKYKIAVKLTNGLNTSYNRKLEFKPELKGRAEIITENLSILERIFNKLKKLLQNT